MAGFEPATFLQLVDTDCRNERTNSGFVSLLRSSTSPLTYVIVFPLPRPPKLFGKIATGGEGSAIKEEEHAI